MLSQPVPVIDHFRDTFLQSIRHYLVKTDVPRLKKCLHELTEAQIWHRPNEHSNSVGNLVLHLMGNVRQWVLAGLDGARDTRQRDLEFSETGPVPLEQLLRELDELMAEVDRVLEHTTTENLLRLRTVQCYEETGISILTHVTEHFSYHLGQITYVVKLWKNQPMGYYDEMDLNAKG